MRLGGALLVCVAALVLAPAAFALDCPNVPLDERLDAADAAFVGRVTAERAGASGGYVYRFVVDQNVKGPVGKEVDVHSAVRLVDATDKPIVHDEALGVLARLSGAELTTEPCSLSDPGTLRPLEADMCYARDEKIKGRNCRVLLTTAVAWLDRLGIYVDDLLPEEVRDPLNPLYVFQNPRGGRLLFEREQWVDRASGVVVRCKTQCRYIAWIRDLRKPVHATVAGIDHEWRPVGIELEAQLVVVPVATTMRSIIEHQAMVPTVVLRLDHRFAGRMK